MLDSPMRSTWMFLAVPAALLLTAACGGSQTALGPDVWATVDDREISREEVDKAYRRIVQPDSRPPSQEETLTVKMGIVDELITQEVLLGRARELQINLTDDELNAAFAERRANLSEEAFQEQLKGRNLTDADLRQVLRRELLVDKVMEQEIFSKISVSDQEISEFYNGNRERFNVAETQYRVAQIVVTPMRDADLRNRLNDDATSPEEAQRKAQMLMEKLKSGADFGQLAVDYSEDPQTAPGGGDLGFIPASALQQAPPQLRDVVLKSEPGNVNLVSAGGGHTLVLLVSREQAGQRDLNNPQVREGIRDMLRDQKVQLLRVAYITTARNNAKIVNHLARTLVESQGVPPGLAPSAPGR